MKAAYKVGQNVIIQRPFPALPIMGWGYIHTLSIVRIGKVLPEKDAVRYGVDCPDGTHRYVDEFFLESIQLEIN